MRADFAIEQGSPLDLFRRGELRRCIEAVHEHSPIEDRQASARAHIRLRDYHGALAQLAFFNDDPDIELTRDALRAQCYTLLSMRDYSAELCMYLLERVSAARKPDAVFEAVYAIALHAWVGGNLALMRDVLRFVDYTTLSPWCLARWYVLRSWMASESHQFVEQTRWLERACRLMQEEPPAFDATLMAAMLQRLSHLCREIFATGTYAFATSLVASFEWPSEYQDARYMAMRSMAWAHALRGEFDAAMGLALSATEIAPSKLWRISSFADQAYLARMAGDRYSSDALLRHGTQLAHSASWSENEERMALLLFAELHADRDIEEATKMLALYDSVGPLSPAWSFAHDRRRPAFEAYARGCIFAAQGNVEEAIKQLTFAYDEFSSMHHAWRAAASALRLYKVTEDSIWLDLAVEAVRDFPDSSVARDIARPSINSAESLYGSLTLTERIILPLLCAGKSDEQIAVSACKSISTVRSHNAAIRQKFGVKSRAAVIAEAHRLSLA